MELKVKIPFQQILIEVKSLTPAQKVRLTKELTEEKNKVRQHSDFTRLLLNGPVFNSKQIKTIEENRKSIAKWRTKV